MPLPTIREITSELDRLAFEIARINARPFGDRIDLQIEGRDGADSLIGTGNFAKKGSGVNTADILTQGATF